MTAAVLFGIILAFGVVTVGYWVVRGVRQFWQRIAHADSIDLGQRYAERMHAPLVLTAEDEETLMDLLRIARPDPDALL